MNSTIPEGRILKLILTNICHNPPLPKNATYVGKSEPHLRAATCERLTQNQTSVP